jgi:carbamoyltransferase
MYILGLGYVGHDSSAAILKDGEVLASAMEERFTRIKRDRSFPEKAINFCLDFTGISIKDVDVIAYYMEPDKFFRERVIHHLGRYYPKSVPLFEGNLARGLEIKNVEWEIRERLKFLKEIYFCDHHMAHLASSFFHSTFDDCVSISMDGLGEIASTVIATVDKDYSINVLNKINFPHSLGVLYTCVTHFLGFQATSDAGKVMGLASYGDPDVFIDKFRKIVTLKEDGTYEFDLEYFDYPFKRDTWISEKFIETFGPRRLPDEPLNKDYEDVAAALQLRIEEAYFHMAEYAKRVSQKENLCLSGGVALNSVANGWCE